MLPQVRGLLNSNADMSTYIIAGYLS